MMDSLFSYTPLANPRSQIRLLHISLDVNLFYNISSSKPLACTIASYDLLVGSQSRAQRMLVASRLPYFYALSYVWGDPTKSMEILIDGNPFGITENLYLALRSMQSGITGSMHVWADAICINQEDNDEKSAQIQLMREIYYTAGEVRIWLGLATPETTRCLEFMFKLTGDAGELRAEPKEADEGDINDSAVGRAFASGLTGFIRGGVRFGSMLENTDLIWDAPTTREKSVKLLSAKNKSKFYESSLGSLEAWKPRGRRLRNAIDVEGDFLAMAKLIDMHFTQHPWFNRMWVVQELCCARDCLVQIGRSSLGWDHFVKSVSYLHFHAGAKMENMRKIIGLEIIRLGWTSGQRQSLWDLVRETSFREATDARDKIYSLHGLMGDMSPDLLTPDYTLSVAEVFTRTTRHIITHAKSLDPLRWGKDLSPANTLVPKLPSWVPDYTLIHKETSSALDYISGDYSHFAASGYDYRAEYVPTLTGDDLATLRVRGILIDTIISISAVPVPVLPKAAGFWLAAVGKSELQSQLSQENRDLLSCVSELIHLYFEILCRAMVSRLPGEFAGMTERKLDNTTLLKTLLGLFNHNEHDTSASEHLQKLLSGRMSAEEQEALGQFLTTPRALSRPEEYLTKTPANTEFKTKIAQALTSIFSSRAFAVTENGYLGAVNCASRPGDVATVLYGASIVCILRPLPDGNLKEKEYLLVGEAYLHGFMNAEAIAMCVKGQLEETDFALR